MSTKQAAIRLTLNSGSFRAEMRSLTGRAAASGRMMGRALSAPLSAGFNTAKRSLADLGSGMKNTIKTYGTLAGTIATGMLTKDAIELQGVYRDLAFDVAKLNGEAVKWQDIQKDVEGAALATAQRASTMAGAFGDVYRATGDIEYTRKVLETIGIAATASGKEAANYATMAQMMMRKFSIAAEDVPDAMAAMTQQVNSGALGLDGLTSRFGMLAGEAKAAGMTGVDGMTRLLGIFRLLDGEMGEKLSGSMTTLFQSLKENSNEAERLKKVGFKFEADSTPVERIFALIKHAEGRKLFQKILGKAPARTAFDLLAKPFDIAMKEAEEKGMNKAQQVDIAMAALDRSFGAASDTTWDFAEMLRTAHRRMKDDPTVKLRMAMAKLETAFAQPKTIAAITKLADKLPILADKLADLVDWAVDNPWKAVGAAAGFKVAGPAIGSAIGAAVVPTLKTIGPGIVGSLGPSVAALGTAAGALTAAGAGIAGALGGVAGYGIYKKLVEPKTKEHFKKLRNKDEFVMTAYEAVHRKNITKKELTTVLAQTRKLQKEGGPDWLQSYLSHTSKFYGADIESAEKQHANRLGKLADAEMKLINRIEKMDRAAANATGSIKKMGDAAEPAPGKAPAPSRGVKQPANSAPGAAPVGG